jgi:hypothetical protein
MFGVCGAAWRRISICLLQLGQFTSIPRGYFFNGKILTTAQALEMDVYGTRAFRRSVENWVLNKAFSGSHRHRDVPVNSTEG